MTDYHSRCEWVNISSGTSSPGLWVVISHQRAVKWLWCVYVLLWPSYGSLDFDRDYRGKPVPER